MPFAGALAAWLRFLPMLLVGFAFPGRLAAQSSGTAPSKLAVVRHAPTINGRIEGSAQQLTGESVNFNSGAFLSGDFLVPGTPTVNVNGSPTWSGQQTGTGSTMPTGYTVTVNSGVSLRYLIKRTDPVALPTVAVPPNPTGTRNLTISSPAEASAIGTWSTVKDLTLNSGAGNVSVPAGTYGVFNASNSDGTGFSFGVAGATTASVYNLQQLTLNSNSRLVALGPVIINVKGQVALNSNTIVFGSSSNPGWVTLNVSSSGVSVNSGAVVYGAVNAPAGKVDLNGKIVGSTASDQLSVNSGGVLQAGAAATPANQAPAVDAGPAQTITLPATATLAGRVSDDGLPSGAAVSSTWSKASGPGTVSFSNAGSPTSTASFSQAGTYVLTLAASDTQLTGSANVTITVNAANQAPVVSAGANQAIALPAAATLNGSVSDDGRPAGAAVTSTWSKTSGPGSVTFANAASPQTSASFSVAGTYVLTLSASDTALSSSASVTISVTPQNQAPGVSAGAAQSVTLPATASLSGSASDDGLPNPPAKLTLAWTKVSGPGSVTFSAPAAAATQASFSAPGSYVLRLTANDGALTSTADMTVTVAAQNQAPTVSAGPAQTVRLPAGLTLGGSASDDGLPNPPAKLVSAWTQVSGPGTATFTTPASTNTDVRFDQAGTYVLRLSANDGALSSASDMTITVKAANVAPVVSAGVAQTVTLPASANLAGSVSDDGVPEGATVTSTWSQVSGPGTTTFSSIASAQTGVSFSRAGTYVLRLTGNDTELSAAAEVTITVNPANSAPVALAQSVTTDEDTPVVVTLVGTDPEGAALTYTVVDGPQHGQVQGTAPNLTYAPAGNFNGADAFTFRVNDGTTDSAPATVTITVNAVNDAPAAATLSLGTGEETPLPLTLAGSDADGDELTYAIVTPPQYGTLTGTAPNLTYTPMAFFHGTDAFTYRVGDGTADSASAIVSIDVSHVNHAPVATPYQGIVNAAGGNIINLDIRDPDTVNNLGSQFGSPDQITVEVCQPPAQGTATVLSTHEILFTGAPDAHGQDVLVLCVSDGHVTVRVSVTLTLNRQPSVGAITRSYQTRENQPLPILLEGADPDNDPVTYIVTSQPGHGTLSGNAPNLTYTPAPGFHGQDGFTFKVNDGHLDSEPASVLIQVDSLNRPPVVRLTAPATATTLNEGDSLALEAEAIDPDGNLKFVRFYAGGQLQASYPAVGGQSIYRHQLTGLVAGERTLRAEAVDEENFGAFSDGVTLTVNLIGHAPVADLFSPVDGAVLAAGQPLVVRAQVGDLDGDLRQVEFYNNGALRQSVPVSGADTTANPYQINIPGLAAGLQTLQVIGVDGRGHRGRSQIVAVFMGHMPTVELVEPLNDQVFQHPATVSLKANAAVEGAQVAKVEFIDVTGVPSYGPQNGSVVATVTGPVAGPYAGTWPNPGPGRHAVVARVTSTDGLIAYSERKSVLVNRRPVVTIDRPADGVRVRPGQPVEVQVTAADYDQEDYIARLSLYDGDNLLREITTGPVLRFTWAAPAPGTHTLRAVATDRLTGRGEAVPVHLTVADGADGGFVVTAGSGGVLALSDALALSAQATLDGAAPTEAVTYNWSQADGPGAVTFDDAGVAATRARFSAVGDYLLMVQARSGTQTASTTVRATVLPATAGPRADTVARSSRGREFWSSPRWTYSNGEFSRNDFHLSVQAERATRVQVEQFFDGYSSYVQTLDLAAGETKRVECSTYLGDNGQPARSSVHLTATDDVAVSAIDSNDAGNAGWSVLPTSCLGTEYLVMAYGNGRFARPDGQNFFYHGGTGFVVVATADNTQLSVTPAVAVGAHPVGVAYGVILQRGQSYFLAETGSFNADLTGTGIIASQPVAVFGGHRYTQTLAAVDGDAMVEQLLPTNLWGRRHALLPMVSAPAGGNLARVLAATDGTRVAVNRQVVASLNRGQFYDLPFDAALEVTADEPVLVAQFATGTVRGTSEHGGPSMSLVPPLETWAADYRFTTSEVVETHYYEQPPEAVFDNFVNVVVPQDTLPSLRLDSLPLDAAVAAAFRVIGAGTDGAGATSGSAAGLLFAGSIPVTEGSHRLTADGGFGALVYGFAKAAVLPYGNGGYAFPAGFAAATVGNAALNELRLASPAALVGTTQVATARVLRADGLGQAGIAVRFSVAGANPTAGEVVVPTDETGEAVFTWTGTQPGQDTVVARLGETPALSVPADWVLTGSGGNRPPSVAMVTPGPERVIYAFIQPTFDGGSYVLYQGGSATVALMANASDDGLPAGGTLTARWRQTGGFGRLAISDPSKFVTTATVQDGEDFVVEVRASDGELSAADTVRVRADRVPDVRLDRSWWQTLYKQGTLQILTRDDDDAVIKVEVFEGATKLGEATAGTPTNNYGQPFSFDYVLPTVGEHRLRLVATDTRGGVGSGEETISIASETTASWLTPLAGVPVGLGTPARLSVAVEDPDQPPGQDFVVRYYLDYNIYLGEGSGPTYALDWTPAQLGDHELHAYVYNALGGQTVVDRPVRVVEAGHLPMVGLTSPSAGQNLGVNRPVTLQAIAAPAAVAVGSTSAPIERVEFYAGTRLLGQSSGVHYALAWVPTVVGDITLVARAYDTAGQVGSSPAVTVRVAAAALPTPVVHLSAPADGATVGGGVPVTLAAEASQAGGSVVRVEFYADGADLGGVGTAPYTLAWTPPAAAGGHVLTAAVLCADGQGAVSNPVNVNVAPPTPVILRLTAPVENKLINVGASVLLISQVDSGVERLASVKFAVNGAPAGESPIDPNDGSAYVEWRPLGPGNYQIQAVGCDAAGNALAQSASVAVRVAYLVAPTVTIINPVSGLKLAAGSTNLPVQVQASDADGTIVKVEIYGDGQLLARSATAPLNYTWAQFPGGRHELRATATDDTDLQTISAPVRFVVERSVASSLIAPASLSAVAESAERIQLTWAAPPAGANVAGTVIERRAGVEGTWEEIGAQPLVYDEDASAAGVISPESWRFSDSGGLEPETFYSYRVAYLAANDERGARGAYSAESSDTTMVAQSSYVVIDLSDEFVQNGVAARLKSLPARPRAAASGKRPVARAGATTPIDLGDQFTPLWMAANGTVLLRQTDQVGSRYVLRLLDGRTAIIGDPNFTAHRLSRDGQRVVGERQLAPKTYSNLSLPRSEGVVFQLKDQGQTLSLEQVATTAPEAGAYRYPKDAPAPGPLDAVGIRRRLSDLSELDDVYGSLPQLHSIWDLNGQGQAAATLGVYVRPYDYNGNKRVDGNKDVPRQYDELRNFNLEPLQALQFDMAGDMLWTSMTERGASAGYSADAVTQVEFTLHAQSAARLELGTGGSLGNGSANWKWLGPLSLSAFGEGLSASTSTVAKVVNEGGAVAGFGARSYSPSELGGAPATRADRAAALNAYAPTHAFRWPTQGQEYVAGNGTPVSQDLGVLPSGFYSYPEAMNAEGNIVGFGNLQVVNTQTGDLNLDPTKYRAILWPAGKTQPTDLGVLAENLPGFPLGYARAYDINNSGQIVGESVDSDDLEDINVDVTSRAVLWQTNRNRGSAPTGQVANVMMENGSDLNTLLANRAEWQLQRAVGISEDGVILVMGYRRVKDASGEHWAPRAALLVPFEFQARTAFSVGFDPPLVTDKDPAGNRDIDRWEWWTSVGDGAPFQVNERVKLLTGSPALAQACELAVAPGSENLIELTAPAGGVISGRECNLTITGKPMGLAQPAGAVVELRLRSSKQVLAKLNVSVLKVFKPIIVSLYKVTDQTTSTSAAATEVINPLPPTWSLQNMVDEVFQPACVQFMIDPTTPERNLAFDKDGDGLVRLPQRGNLSSQEEFKVFADARSTTLSGKVSISFVRGINEIAAAYTFAPSRQVIIANDLVGTRKVNNMYSPKNETTGIESSREITFAHELGHVLDLSSRRASNGSRHDDGPYPNKTRSLMHNGLPNGRWLRHEDWQQANVGAGPISR